MARRMPTLTVPVAANVPVNDIPAPEWLGVKGQTEVMAALRFDAADPAYGAVRGAVDAAQRTANRIAIQTAADDAASTGGTLVLKGMYEVDATLTFACHVDGLSGEIRVHDKTITPVIRVGTTTPGSANLIRRKTVLLPTIINTDRVNASGTWGDNVGVELANLDTSFVTIPHVRWFGTGTLVTAYGQGTCYNQINVGHMDTNRVNLELRPGDTTAWVNNNIFNGGRFFFNSAEGMALPDVRQILLSPSPPGGFSSPNNNLFVGPSIEGNVPEIHVECYGRYNTFLQARWEATTPRIRFNGTDSWLNVVEYGYGVEQLRVQMLNGAYRNTVKRPQGTDLYLSTTAVTSIGNEQTVFQYPGSIPGVVVQKTGSSSDLGLVVLPAGVPSANAETAYTIGLRGDSLRLKATGDTQPRWQVVTANGNMLWGPGNAAPDVAITRRAAKTVALGSGQAFGVGTTTTAGRPSAATVGAGAMLYDTTLNKPIWSDGSAWRDATGTVV